MHLTEVLRREHVLAPLQAETVREALQRLVERLVASGSILRPAQLERLVGEEQVRDIINVGDRVRLAHLRTDAVERLVVGLAVTATPLRRAADSSEGTAQVVVLVLGPGKAADLYLQLIAALTRVLRSDELVERLVLSASPHEVLALPEFRNLTLQPRLTVRDVMTQRVYRVSPEATVRELLELMSRNDLKAVPVVGEKREVLGMVTERELLRHLLPTAVRGGGEREEAATGGGGAQDVQVREIMSRSVMCIPEEQSLTEVASIMVNKDTERLPVVSEGKLTGFLTRGDILRKLFGTLR